MNPKRGSKTHEIALSGLLFALAMALSFVEGTLVIPGLMPGMKLGLANIVVMYYEMMNQELMSPMHPIEETDSCHTRRQLHDIIIMYCIHKDCL